MKSFLFLFLITGQFCFAQNSLDKLLEKFNKGSVPYMTISDLHKIKDSVVILDTREKEEFEISHIPKAKYVGYKNFSLQKLDSLKIPKTSTIVVYCSLGIRSENIGEKIKEYGYPNVLNLYGGIFEWKNNNLEIVNNNKITDSIHTFSKKWSKWVQNGIKVY